MKRYFHLAIVVSLILFLTGCMDTTTNIESRDGQMETEHFIYYFDNKQHEKAMTLRDELESEYARISKLLDVTITDKLHVTIFASQAEYMEKTGNPQWSAGGYSNDGLLVTPVVTKEIAVHELTHVLINRINPNTPRWLNEGISSYVAGDMRNPMEIVARSVELGIIPPLSSYSVEDPSAFMMMNGYAFSYALTEYIVTAYSWEQLNELIRSPYDFEGVFQMTDEQFWHGWEEDLKERFEDN